MGTRAPGHARTAPWTHVMQRAGHGVPCAASALVLGFQLHAYSTTVRLVRLCGTAHFSLHATAIRCLAGMRLRASVLRYAARCHACEVWQHGSEHARG